VLACFIGQDITTVIINQGCGAIVTMSQLRLRLGALLFMNMAPAPVPELLIFMRVAPALELSFFMSPASVRFHTLILLIVLVCLKLNVK